MSQCLGLVLWNLVKDMYICKDYNVLILIKEKYPPRGLNYIIFGDRQKTRLILATTLQLWQL